MEDQRFLLKDIGTIKKRKGELLSARKRIRLMIEDDMAEINKLHEIDVHLLNGAAIIDRTEDVLNLAVKSTTPEEKREIMVKIKDLKDQLKAIIKELDSSENQLNSDEQSEDRMAEQLASCVKSLEKNSLFIDDMITAFKD
jgi:hypothetical protein